jgi:hypothetical protein
MTRSFPPVRWRALEGAAFDEEGPRALANRLGKHQRGIGRTTRCRLGQSRTGAFAVASFAGASLWFRRSSAGRGCFDRIMVGLRAARCTGVFVADPRRGGWVALPARPAALTWKKSGQGHLSMGTPLYRDIQV